MTVFDACLERRSIRKFAQRPVPRAVLLRCIEAARVAPSGANLQPVKYCLVDDAARVKAVFPHLAWAAYIKPDGDPRPGEEPTAYIVVLHDTAVRPTGADMDIGAAVQSILLVAHEQGVASCWLGSVDRPAVAALLGLPETLRIAAVLALGYPAETSVSEESVDGNIRYYRGADGRLHVPKRPWKDLLLP